MKSSAADESGRHPSWLHIASGNSASEVLSTDPVDHGANSVAEYLTHMTALSEPVSQKPPRKRQRLSFGSDLDHMVVKRSSITIKFHQPTQRNGKSNLAYQSTTARTVVTEFENQVVLMIVDKSDKNWDILKRVVEADSVPLQDIKHAAMVASRVDSKHNPAAHGRLWTETGFVLSVQDGFDVLLLTWTIKWNFSPSLEYISATRPAREALNSIIATYFPDPARKGNNHSHMLPQDFYSSVHLPPKYDAVAASIETPDLQTQLYPFQKRAVQWLLKREGARWSMQHRSVNRAILKSEAAPCSFYKVVDEDGRTCWISSLLQAATDDLSLYKLAEDSLMGGMLVEEMGLGKTLEVIALITLHRRNLDNLENSVDPYISQKVTPVGATLIITPPSIVKQWESELARHAPSLKVFHYKGKKKDKTLTDKQLFEKVADQDVVLTTYNVLAREIYIATPPPDRELRGSHEIGSKVSNSIFTQFSWWRCVLDEAQMVESGVTQAATVARMVPRVNAWAVTGTPVRKDVEDLYGLLKFIRYEPFGTLKWTWYAILRHQSAFQTLFQRIALRHTKSLVRAELLLPPQKRYVITMPFTPIEEQHYQSLFQQMCEECGVNLQGEPLTDQWDPNNGKTLEKMRTWLGRLRQSALHPEIGVRNRRALGRKDGPLRTVDQVLETMLDQTELSIRGDQRSLLLTRLKMGQLLENSPRVKEALAIWESVLIDANAAVLVCRQQLQHELDTFRRNQELGDKNASSGDGSSSEDLEPSIESSARLGAIRNRLNAALEVQHMAVFFCANAHFQIKTNGEMTTPDSADFKELEKLEAEGYQQAKMIRQEILKEILRKNMKPMDRLAKKASSEDFLSIPEFRTDIQKGGIESRRLLEQLDELAAMLDAQANQLDEWREATIQSLLVPLIDEDEAMEMTGDEYEQSTKTQEEVVIYVQVLRAAIEDRHDALSGQENHLVKYEVKTAMAQAKAGEGPSPKKVRELLDERAKIKPPKALGSIRGILSELKALSSQLKLDAKKGSLRATNELAIVERNMKAIRDQLDDQQKAVVALRYEVDEFTTLMNLRVEYYRQLQQISDMVAPLTEPAPELHNDLKGSEQMLVAKIATTASKLRYLVHLQNESTTEAEGKDCLICQSPFENGSLTVCGHIFCKECMELWWRAHHNCPVCKRRLILNDLHDITYKPQELKVVEEVPITTQDRERGLVATSAKSEIYSQISKDTLAQIKNIDLVGPSFTTKVDTLCRHLLWLRESDPYAKSIVFSQFRDFLKVLGRAFEHHRIGYSTIEDSRGIEKFKENPATECFLLHAKSQSSGLNLVNASHVFLCEPLINTAIELQAIARVDRIGQLQDTTVWLYLVDGTVEEAIYDISVRRRMEHIGQASREASKEGTPELADCKIEAANSLELQQASLANLLTKEKSGGEMVRNADLWECLFGNKKGQEERAVAEERLDREVARHFGAEAAEARIVEGE